MQLTPARLRHCRRDVASERVDLSRVHVLQRSQDEHVCRVLDKAVTETLSVTPIVPLPLQQAVARVEAAHGAAQAILD